MCLLGFMKFHLLKWQTIGHNYLNMPDFCPHFVFGADLRKALSGFISYFHTHPLEGVVMPFGFLFC